MVSLDFLEKVDIFKDLNDDQLTAVQDCCEEETFERGERIFGVDEDPDTLWVVKTGKVELRQDRPDTPPELKNITISTISENMMFGWSSLVPPHKYRLSAYCVSRKCRLVKVDKVGISRLIEQDSQMGYYVMSRLLVIMGTRFHQLREEIIKALGQDIINRW